MLELLKTKKAIGIYILVMVISLVSGVYFSETKGLIDILVGCCVGTLLGLLGISLYQQLIIGKEAKKLGMVKLRLTGPLVYISNTIVGILVILTFIIVGSSSMMLFLLANILYMNTSTNNMYHNKEFVILGKTVMLSKDITSIQVSKTILNMYAVYVKKELKTPVKTIMVNKKYLDEVVQVLEAKSLVRDEAVI